jgi:hypothetical protein
MSKHPRGRHGSLAKCQRSSKNHISEPLLRRVLWRVVWLIPVALSVGLGIISTLLFIPNAFAVSTFFENAQASVELKLDFTQRPPIDGSEWPGGDPSPNPALILQTWRYNGSHSSGRDPRLAPLTCRMYHVCQFADGSVLLPEAFRALERSVRSCGIEKYMFARQARPETRFDHSHGLNDLISPSAPPSRGAAVAQLLYFFQIVFGQHISREEWSSDTVDYRRYNGSGDLVDTNGRVNVNVAKPLTPLIFSGPDFVPDDFDEEGNKQTPTWEKDVIEKLKKSMEGFEVHRFNEAFPDRDENGGDPSTADKPQAVCYHSIMSTGEKGDELPPRMMGKANPFFARNGIERSIRWSRELDFAAHNASTESQRAKDITSKVRADDGNLNILFIRGGLSMEDLDSVEKRLEGRLKTAAAGGKVKLHVSTVRFEAKADVALLYSEFQRADVVVAAHSAVLNNIMYMRARSLLVEILPYSIPDEVYGRVAATLGVSHVAIMAKADSKSFRMCIQSDWSSSGDAAERLLKAWDESSKQFVAGDRKSYLDFKSPRSRWRNEVPRARQCAFRQSCLKLVSTEAILRAIFDRAVVPRL